MEPEKGARAPTGGKRQVLRGIARGHGRHGAKGLTDTLDRLNELADVKREAETDTVPRIVFTPSKRQ